MTFWSDESKPLEPKRQSRWVAYIGTSASAIQPYLLKTAEKPQMEQGEAEHNYLGQTYYFPGSIKWKEASFTLVDPLDSEESSLRRLMSMIEAAGYHPLNDGNDIAFITKASAMAQLGGVRIVQMDFDGTPLETWTLHNAWVKNVDSGNLDYKSDDLVEVKLTVRFDWASSTYGKTISDPSKARYGVKRLVETE